MVSCANGKTPTFFVAEEGGGLVSVVRRLGLVRHAMDDKVLGGSAACYLLAQGANVNILAVANSGGETIWRAAFCHWKPSNGMWAMPGRSL